MDAPEPVPDERLPRARRVTERSAFRRAQAHAGRVHTPHFVVLVMPRAGKHESSEGRVGITVTKRIARAAVDRNRIKRVVREVFRKHRARFPEGCDVVFVAKQGAPRLGYAEVLAEVERAERAIHGAARTARKRAPAESTR